MLIKLIEELQDYLIQTDPLKRLRRLLEYGEIYTNNLHGVIYIAELKNTTIGMITGIIQEFTKSGERECIPSKEARI